MSRAKVVWFNKQKGIGFIKPDDSETDLFVHWTNIEMEGFKKLEPGQEVEFELGENHKGAQAVKVKVI